MKLIHILLVAFVLAGCSPSCHSVETEPELIQVDKQDFAPPLLLRVLDTMELAGIEVDGEREIFNGPAKMVPVKDLEPLLSKLRQYRDMVELSDIDEALVSTWIATLSNYLEVGVEESSLVPILEVER